MRDARRARRAAAIATVLSSIAVLGPAASADAQSLPPNPEPCRIEPGPELPCTPGYIDQLHGSYTFSVPLSDATQDETGIPGDPGATGTSNITFDLNGNRVCADTQWFGVDSPVVAGHIHGGARGQPENPAITISLFPANFMNGVPSPARACTSVPSAELWAIAQCPRQFNVVIHSKAHPVGALRGQMGTACNIDVTT
jgi:hypothetical protein